MNTSLESLIIRMEINALQFTPVLFIGVQPTQHYWHAINPALPARYLLLRERYYAPIPYITSTVLEYCIGLGNTIR